MSNKELSFDKKKVYPLETAVSMLKNASHEKFDATIELHAKLGIDPRQSTQQIRATVTLPHSFGKSKKIAAFVNADKQKEAKEAGAEIVGAEDLINEIKQTGKIDFEVAIATPDMMKLMTPIAKILGPKGLMPSPKNETISNDIAKTIQEIKKGKINYKNDDTSNIHVTVGKRSMTDAQLLENITAFLTDLKRNKPAGSKGLFFRSVTLCSSMGPGIKIESPK